MLDVNESLGKGSYWVGFLTAVVTHDFPFWAISAGHIYANPDYYVKRSERHEAYLLYTVSGEGVMTWKGDTIKLLPKSCCLIFCEDYQYYKTVSTDRPWEYYYIHFKGKGIEAYAPYLLNQLKSLSPKSPSDFQAKMHFMSTEAPRLSFPMQSSRINTTITELLDAMLDAYCTQHNEEKATSINETLFPAYLHIWNHYFEQISLDYLAELCSLSKYHFLRQFKTASGETPYQYLSRYRIGNAKRMLSDPETPITTIAEMVGYANYTNFLTQFKKYTGTTPQEYREHLNDFPDAVDTTIIYQADK